MINILGKVSPLFFLLSFFLFNTALAAEEISPTQELAKIISVLAIQADELNKGLNQLKNLSENQEFIKTNHANNLKAIVLYYQSLKINEDGSNVKDLASEIKENRQEIFNPQLKRASEFLLAFQTKSVLKTAESRFLKINTDIDRLSGLEILEKSKPQILLNEAHLSLVAADGFVEKAEFWV